MDKTTYYYNIFLQNGLTLNSLYKENEILDALDSIVMIFSFKNKKMLIIKFSVRVLQHIIEKSHHKYLNGLEGI